MERLTKKMPTWLSKATTAILTGIMFFVTLPYGSLMIYNTVRTAQSIEELAGLDLEVPEHRTWLLDAISVWHATKREELSFVAIASAAMTAIITASFSWKNVETSHWAGAAFWYAALPLCLLGIFLSSQQISLLSIIQSRESDVQGGERQLIQRHLMQILARKNPNLHSPSAAHVEAQAGHTLDHGKPSDQAVVVVEVATTPTAREPQKWVLSPRKLFVWQCSIMVVAWSAVFYLMGLSVVVCTPLLENDEWEPDSYAAVVYIAFLSMSAWLYSFCSYGAYRYIHDGDNANRTFVEEVGRRVRIFQEGRDPFKRRRAAIGK
ncbi:hypothetical protein B0T20DRAFT_364515 [Sordaria brevicollis]|uniref:Uncharacterized protein n=1 Tax=Sordaria brevicollis TaxID=83679 RepID=A0AAE0U2S5_SORBR|nr:hypothetical protein B0T20DRAFT_364515 [Sordaria brevicollis]